MLRQESYPDYTDISFMQKYPTLNEVLREAKRFPKRAPQLMKFILDTPSEFLRLINTINDLNSLAFNFPTMHHEIITFVVSPRAESATLSEFDRLVKNNRDFLSFAKTFPQHAPSLFFHFIAQIDISHLLTSKLELWATVNQFPTLAPKLLEKILENKTLFCALIETEDDYKRIKGFTKRIPSLATMEAFNITREKALTEINHSATHFALVSCSPHVSEPKFTSPASPAAPNESRSKALPTSDEMYNTAQHFDLLATFGHFSLNRQKTPVTGAAAARREADEEVPNADDWLRVESPRG